VDKSELFLSSLFRKSPSGIGLANFQRQTLIAVKRLFYRA